MFFTWEAVAMPMLVMPPVVASDCEVTMPVAPLQSPPLRPCWIDQVTPV
jgi:hypothetical protein